MCDSSRGLGAGTRGRLLPKSKKQTRNFCWGAGAKIFLGILMGGGDGVYAAHEMPRASCGGAPEQKDAACRPIPPCSCFSFRRTPLIKMLGTGIAFFFYSKGFYFGLNQAWGWPGHQRAGAHCRCMVYLIHFCLTSQLRTFDGGKVREYRS